MIYIVVFGTLTAYSWWWYFTLRNQYKRFNYTSFHNSFKYELACAILLTLATLGFILYHLP